MAARVEETAAGEAVLNDGALSAVLSAGVGGYLWRLAEREVGRHIGDTLDEVVEAIGLFEDDEALADSNTTLRQRVLYQSSARCIESKVPLWRTSPGNLIWGYDLFRAGQQFVAERTGALDERIDPGDLFYAFYFGVALFHVESQLDRPDAPTPGDLAGPGWEQCEIVLRSEVPAFVAEAEGPTGSYDGGRQSQAPALSFLRRVPSKDELTTSWTSDTRRLVAQPREKQVGLRRQRAASTGSPDRFRRRASE